MRRLLLLLTAAAMVWACTTQLTLPGSGSPTASGSPTGSGTPTSPPFTPTTVITPTPTSTTWPGGAMNNCFRVIGTAGIGTVAVASNGQIQPTNEVLLLQVGTTMVLGSNNLPGALDVGSLGSAGIFDLRLVAKIEKSAASEVLTLDRSLSIRYGRDGAAELCTVPYFATLTMALPLFASPWDPASGAGGVVAIRADNIDNQVGLFADGAGFGGGAASGKGLNTQASAAFTCDPTVPDGSGDGSGSAALGGYRGMSVAVLATALQGCYGENFTGGGGGLEGEAGGGGGAGAGAGGDGGYGASGGAAPPPCSSNDGPCGNGGLPLADSTLLNQRLLFGGGGGGGDGVLLGGAGGSGGGIILLLVTTALYGAGDVSAQGIDGSSASSSGGGGGGGGAAGTIRIDAASLSSGGIFLLGGNGGGAGVPTAGVVDGPGGGGGGGRVIYGSATPTSAAFVGAGTFGLTNGQSGGAESGSPGFGARVTPIPTP